MAGGAWREASPVQRIWDIVAILKEHGVPVRMITSDKPGKIVYADEYTGPDFVVDFAE